MTWPHRRNKLPKASAGHAAPSSLSFDGAGFDVKGWKGTNDGGENPDANVAAAPALGPTWLIVPLPKSEICRQTGTWLWGPVFKAKTPGPA